MAEGAKSSWKDEWFVIILSIPLISMLRFRVQKAGLTVGSSSFPKHQTGIFTA